MVQLMVTSFPFRGVKAHVSFTLTVCSNVHFSWKVELYRTVTFKLTEHVNLNLLAVYLI